MTNQQELAKTLEKLHKALQNYQPEQALDIKSTELLGQIEQDIRNISEAHSTKQEARLDALEESIIHFEQDHPTLTAILRDIADLLNKSGI